MKMIDETRYKMLEDLHLNVYNYIRGMRPDQLEKAKARNGWHHWMDESLTRIDEYDAAQNLTGLAAMVGDAKPGPVLPTNTAEG